MRKILLYILLPALMLSGCVSEEEFIAPDNGNGKQLEATLTLRVTGGSTAATRALTAEDENEIEEIDVLVFKKASGETGNGTFDYRAQTTLIKTDPDDVTKATKNFKVTLRRSANSNDLQKLVVLANSRSAVEALEALGDMTGMTYEEVAESLTMLTPTSYHSVWQMNNATQFVPFPMWGEQSGFSVFSGTNAVPDVIELFRAVAAVDVVVGTGAQSDFELTAVHVRVHERRGRLIPASANWNPTKKKAIAPTMPSASLGGAAESYTLTSPGKVEGKIYFFEQTAASLIEGTREELIQEPYLIAQGRYKGGAESFYRVDFFGRDDEDEIADSFLPLLRNFHYTVVIDRVDGDGYPRNEEAMENRFTNMTATTHTWSQGDMGSVVWDGRNYLAVTADSYEIDNTAQTIDYIKVAATREYDPSSIDGGRQWTAAVTIAPGDESNWLSINPGSGGDADGVARPLIMQVKANTHRDRTAIVTVTSGRLKQEIRIMQRVNNPVELLLGDVEMIFSASNPVATPLRVEWTPGTVPVDISYAAASGYQVSVFSPAKLPDVTDDDTTTPLDGTRNYLIKPEAVSLAKFEERRTEMTFTVKDGTELGPNPTKKMVTLRQFDYAIDVATSAAVYQQLESYALTVKCNTEWVMDVDNSNGVLARIDTPIGEPNTSEGEKVYLTMSDLSHDGQSATLTFRSKVPGQFASRVVTIWMDDAEPNCYIVPPGGSVTIPTNKAWKVWKSERDLNGVRSGDASAFSATNPANYTVELLWQDKPGLINAVQWLTNTASASDHFSVQTNGGASGNAVVALKENGVIRWSWHIWVCNYDPDASVVTNSYSGAKFMDRNLGATSSTAPTVPTDISAYGLYYQWGRKDPFPSTTTVYDLDGTPLTEGTQGDAYASGMKKIHTPELNNLANAVRNPFTFYYGSLSWRQYWYTNGTNDLDYRTDFWFSFYKTDYDPCPDGWWQTDIRRLSYARPSPLVVVDGVKTGMQIDGFGYFPLSGMRNAANGNIQHTGYMYYSHRNQIHKGYDVNGVFSVIQLYSEGFMENRMAPETHTPGAAQSIRCVKIE